MIASHATSTIEARGTAAKPAPAAVSAATTRAAEQPVDRVIVEDDIEIAVLDDSRLIDDARNLLYRVYCQEMDWFPPEGNPSGQVLTRLSDGRRS